MIQPVIMQGIVKLNDNSRGYVIRNGVLFILVHSQ